MQADRDVTQAEAVRMFSSSWNVECDLSVTNQRAGCGRLVTLQQALQSLVCLKTSKPNTVTPDKDNIQKNRRVVKMAVGQSVVQEEALSNRVYRKLSDIQLLQQVKKLPRFSPASDDRTYTKSSL